MLFFLSNPKVEISYLFKLELNLVNFWIKVYKHKFETQVYCKLKFDKKKKKVNLL